MEKTIADKEIYKRFSEHLNEAVKGHACPGNAVSDDIAKHDIDLLEDAKSKGAKFLCGGPEYVWSSFDYCDQRDGENGDLRGRVLWTISVPLHR